jgi:predicted metal-dependent hydrolase
VKTGFEGAIEMFNRGDYFGAAEAFEHATADADPDLRELISALNRIAAALHLRFERGGQRGSLNLFAQALLALEDYRPARAGIDVERLCAEVSAFADELRTAPRDETTGLKYRARLFVERRRAPKVNLAVEPSRRS